MFSQVYVFTGYLNGILLQTSAFLKLSSRQPVEFVRNDKRAINRNVVVHLDILVNIL